jgi:hypothetical protein
MKKTVYLYDPVTLAPTAPYDAQESPLEPGVFITPVYCVEIPPPESGANQRVFFDGVSGWVVKDLPVPTQAEQLEAAVAQLRLAVRQHMSATAQASPERFNSISEAKSFTGIDNPYRAVSEAFTVWASQVQTTANTTLDAVLAGQAPLPTLSALIASLPAWEHP